jgi:hypothetical protein
MRIRVDAQVDSNGKCVITCPDTPVNRKHEDWIDWICFDGDLNIHFSQPSPFHDYPNGPTDFSAFAIRPTGAGHIDKTAPKKDYKYTITVQIPNRPDPCVLDPKITLNDGTTLDDAVSTRVTGVLAVIVGMGIAAWGLAAFFRTRE